MLRVAKFTSSEIKEVRINLKNKYAGIGAIATDIFKNNYKRPGAVLPRKSHNARYAKNYQVVGCKDC